MYLRIMVTIARHMRAFPLSPLLIYDICMSGTMSSQDG